MLLSNCQDWLEKHGDYEAIVDGANIGLYQQNFSDGGFSLPQVLPSIFGYLFSSSIFFESIPAILITHTCAIEQLESVVKELYHESGNNKWPLILLHKRRVTALLENPTHRNLVEEWISNGVLYPTPPGSNDDWYEL